MQKFNVSAVIKILKKQDYTLPLAESIKNENNNPFHILVSTILSARTKDTLTEKVCKILFKKVKNAKTLEKITLKELEQLIKPVNYYKTKAKHLKELYPYIKKEIPKTIDELIELPGVGRKTANIVLNTAFGKPAIAVDTHVYRISNRLGYVKTKTPKETEFALREILPKKYWGTYNMLLVMHGQNTCTPNNPKCSTCPIIKYCNRAGVTKSR